MTTNTADTPAQHLRAALKAAGYNARRVSVRHDGNTLRVTVRDANASISAVKAIADLFRHVRYCEATGEILCGGNTFVDVEYPDALVQPIAAAVMARLQPADDGVMVDLDAGFRAAKISRERGATYPDEVRIWGPGFGMLNSIACGVAHAATRIAVAMLDARAAAGQSNAAQEAASADVRA